ncbi:MAG: hypothetical protein ACLRMZ_14500 [Blautia marasmi]
MEYDQSVPGKKGTGDNGEHEMFKTTIMGFDKEMYWNRQRMKDEAA